MKKTTVVYKKNSEREWLLIDASGVRLGRLASTIAPILLGKHKATYTPNTDCGDYVVVINSKKIDVFPARMDRKIYYRHSGYMGGLKEKTLARMIKEKPNDVIKIAVKGMLPHTKLARRMIKKLFVYEESEHKHEANNPQVYKVK